MPTDVEKRLDELSKIQVTGRCHAVCNEVYAIARALLKERDELVNDNEIAAATIRDLLDDRLHATEHYQRVWAERDELKAKSNGD
jgi:hypothetical protein